MAQGAGCFPGSMDSGPERAGGIITSIALLFGGRGVKAGPRPLRIRQGKKGHGVGWQSLERYAIKPGPEIFLVRHTHPLWFGLRSLNSPGKIIEDFTSIARGIGNTDCQCNTGNICQVSSVVPLGLLIRSILEVRSTGTVLDEAQMFWRTYIGTRYPVMALWTCRGIHVWHASSLVPD